MINIEYIREKYFNDIKKLFFKYLNIYNIKNYKKKRYFIVFLNLLYFNDNSFIDDVLVKINNQKSFIIIKQYMNYEKLIYKPYINETNQFIIDWNNITDDYLNIINTYNININYNEDIIIFKYKNNISLTYNNKTLIILSKIYDKLVKLLLKSKLKYKNIYIYILIYRYKYFNLLYDNNQLALHFNFFLKL